MLTELYKDKAADEVLSEGDIVWFVSDGRFSHKDRVYFKGFVSKAFPHGANIKKIGGNHKMYVTTGQIFLERMVSE